MTKMTLKKEVKHSVVYETEEKGAPVKSVYVMKDWFWAQGGGIGMAFPQTIELEVRVKP